ncbi:hypothetical protein POM88_050850 [Heracleum sosnowskyi]|uniref:Uncharacterized protein n=1 Tax=Heracleum sosnowskyi TaxID=360622 RepID=A0AAD8GZF2_9APIA|nr:hypothetical protein POM88_050850 [Heracleum sosnowskyi]
MATISMSCTFLSTARFANLKDKIQECVLQVEVMKPNVCLLTQGLGNLPKVVSLLFMEGPLVDCFLLGKLFAVRPSCTYLEVVLRRGKFLAKISYSFDQLLYSMDKNQSVEVCRIVSHNLDLAQYNSSAHIFQCFFNRCIS